MYAEKHLAAGNPSFAYDQEMQTTVHIGLYQGRWSAVPSKRGLGKNGLDVMFEPVKKVVKERQAGENVGELAVKRHAIPNPSRLHTLMKKALEEHNQFQGKRHYPTPYCHRREPIRCAGGAVGELPRQRGSSRFLLSSVIMMTPL